MLGSLGFRSFGLTGFRVWRLSTLNPFRGSRSRKEFPKRSSPSGTQRGVQSEASEFGFRARLAPKCLTPRLQSLPVSTRRLSSQPNPKPEYASPSPKAKSQPLPHPLYIPSLQPRKIEYLNPKPPKLRQTLSTKPPPSSRDAARLLRHLPKPHLRCGPRWLMFVFMARLPVMERERERDLSICMYT